MSRHSEREFHFTSIEGLEGLTPDLVLNLSDILHCWGRVEEQRVLFNHEDKESGRALHMTGSVLPGVRSMSIFKSAIPRHGTTLININGEGEGFILWDNDLT